LITAILSAKYRSKDRRLDQQWRPGKNDSSNDIAKGTPQSCRWSFEKNVEAVNLFSANKSVLIIESENELIERDLEVTVSKTQRLLYTYKPDRTIEWVSSR